jgi:DNA-binding GntR family transcriptional regulator
MIHAAINTAAKNPVLTSTYKQVNARLQALRFRSNQNGDKWKRAVKEHEKMVEALSARDGATLRALLQQHLYNKRDAVIDQLRHAAAAPETQASR